MAIAIEWADLGHAGIDSTDTTIPFTTVQTVAAGSFIVVCVSWGTANADITCTVAGGGLTWTTDKESPFTSAGQAGLAICSAQAPAGLASSTVLTATFSATTVGRGISGTSFTGVATSTPVDTTSGPTQFTSTTAWTTASTTIAAGSVLIGNAHCTTTNPTSLITAPSLEAQDFGPAGGFEQTVGYRIESSGGAYTVAGTWASTENGTVNAVAYKVAAGAPGLTYDQDKLKARLQAVRRAALY